MWNMEDLIKRKENAKVALDAKNLTDLEREKLETELSCCRLELSNIVKQQLEAPFTGIQQLPMSIRIEMQSSKVKTVIKCAPGTQIGKLKAQIAPVFGELLNLKKPLDMVHHGLCKANNHPALKDSLLLEKVFQSSKDSKEQLVLYLREISPAEVSKKLTFFKEDDDCYICKIKFTQLKRRHHCRKCGNSVCGKCSPGQAKVQGIEWEVRLCTSCMPDEEGLPAGWEEKVMGGQTYYYNAETDESSWTKPTKKGTIEQNQINEDNQSEEEDQEIAEYAATVERMAPPDEEELPPPPPE